MESSNSKQYEALFDDIRNGGIGMLSTHYTNGGKGFRKNGKTLLMCAIDAKNQAAINMILNTKTGKWGAKNLRDNSGKTARELAVNANNRAAIETIDKALKFPPH